MSGPRAGGRVSAWQGRSVWLLRGQVGGLLGGAADDVGVAAGDQGDGRASRVVYAMAAVGSGRASGARRSGVLDGCRGSKGRSGRRGVGCAARARRSRGLRGRAQQRGRVGGGVGAVVGRLLVVLLLVLLQSSSRRLPGMGGHVCRPPNALARQTGFSAGASAKGMLSASWLLSKIPAVLHRAVFCFALLRKEDVFPRCHLGC